MLKKDFQVPKNTPSAVENRWETIKRTLKEYGILSFVVLIIVSIISLVIWDAQQYMNRADKQAEQNLEIGILKERIDNLIKLQEKQCNP